MLVKLIYVSNRATVCLDKVLDQIDGLVQYYSNSIANTLEFLQSYAEPAKYSGFNVEE